MKPTNEFDYEAATMDEKVEYWHTHDTGDTLREFLKMSQDEYDNWQMCPRCANWRPYGFDSYEPAYCRWCGRPLTDAGWEEWITRTSKLLSGS